MRFKINQPPPQPVPSTTFDMMGLTEGEVKAIRASLGRMSPRDSRERGLDHDDVLRIYDALKEGGF